MPDIANINFVRYSKRVRQVWPSFRHRIAAQLLLIYVATAYFRCAVCVIIPYRLWGSTYRDYVNVS